MSGLVRRLAQQARGGAHDRTTTVRSAELVHGRPYFFGALTPNSIPEVPASLATTPAQHAATTSNSSPPVRAEQPRSTFNAREQRTTVEAIEGARVPAPLLESNVAKADADVRVDPFTSRSASERRFPEPLLHQDDRGVERVARITPMAPPPMRARPAESSASNESTEVHVHIGRIDVLAVGDPPKPKTESAAARRPTRPLAEYLKRGGRA